MYEVFFLPYQEVILPAKITTIWLFHQSSMSEGDGTNSTPKLFEIWAESAISIVKCGQLKIHNRNLISHFVIDNQTEYVWLYLHRRHYFKNTNIGKCIVTRMAIPMQGLYSLRRRRLISIGIPIINLRRSSGRLRFIMGIPIPVRRRLLSE